MQEKYLCVFYRDLINILKRFMYYKIYADKPKRYDYLPNKVWVLDLPRPMLA